MSWFSSGIRGLAAAAAALGLGLAAAGAATAATPQPTKEEAGYSFAGGGAHFRYAAASVYLRDPSQYSASIGALGQSVQLWGGGRVYVLGVSDTSTKNTAWSPAVAVFNNATHALVGTGSFGTASYPVDHTVHESIYYNMTTGELSFTVQDITSSMAYTSNTFTMDIGTGVNFTQARIGTEFGDTPWSVPAFTAPTSLAEDSGVLQRRADQLPRPSVRADRLLGQHASGNDRPGERGGSRRWPGREQRLQHLPGAGAVIEGGIKYPGPGIPGPGYHFGLFRVSCVSVYWRLKGRILSGIAPAKPSSRAMIDGSAGDAFTRKGNPSITTGTLRSPASRNR